MRHILVPVDGSDHARKALDVAATLAKANDGSLTILHVESDTPPSSEELELVETEYANTLMQRLAWSQPPGQNPSEFARAAMLQHAKTQSAVRSILSEQLISRSERQAKDRGLMNVRTLFKTGDPAHEILHAVGEEKLDAIVMGTRGMGKLGGLVMGSVSRTVANRAECDVVLVK